MNKRIVLFTLILISILGGLYFFGVAASYWHGYLTDTASTVRYEYMEGVFLALMLSIPFWLLVSALSFPVRKQISRSIYIGLNTPATILCLGFVLINFYVVIMMLLKGSI